MKKNEKTLIAVLVVITIIVIMFAATRKNDDDEVTTNGGPAVVDGVNEIVEVEEKYVVTSNDGTKVNTSDALKSNKVVNNVEFSDIQLSQRNGETLLTATLKNNGSTANELFTVKITLIDDAGKDIVTFDSLVSPMEAGATATFETSMTLDYANAYDFRVEPK